MRPLDIAGMGNVIADFGQQLEIALQENKQLRLENEQFKKEIDKLNKSTKKIEE